MRKIISKIRVDKKSIVKFIIVLVVAFLIGYLPTGYYCMFPGNIISLEDRVVLEEVESLNSFHMTTVTTVRASLPVLIFGHLAPNVRVVPEQNVIPPGWTQKEHQRYAAFLMSNSHNDAKLAVAHLLELEYEEINSSAYVLRTVQNSPAEEVLKSGDTILQINKNIINSTNEAREVIRSFEPFEEVELKLKRDDEVIEKMITLGLTDDGRAFLGVTLIEVDKVVNIIDYPLEIKTGNITGPSAGSMITMELLNKMGYIEIPEDLKVAGTGTINYNGEIGSIGGINQKIVAAYRSNVDVYFMPEVNLKDIVIDLSKYENMEIVPVNFLYEIVDYFKELSGSVLFDLILVA